MKFKKADLKKLRKTLEIEGKKYIIYHRDADGVSSAALIMNFFGGLTPVCREGPIMDEKFIKMLIHGKPKSITFVDIPADQSHEKLIKLKEKIEGVQINIIDHHPYEKNMNPAGIIHINNMLTKKFSNSYIPASCIVYRMLDEMGFDVEGKAWISGIGIIGDYGPKDCKDVLGEVKKSMPELLKGKNPMESPLSNGSDMIAASITVRGIKGADYSLKRLLRSKNFYEFISDPKLIDWNETLQDEVKRLSEEFSRKGEVNEEKKIIFFEITSDYSISSIISTVISEKFENYVVVIFKKWGEMFKFSIRCQDGHIDAGALAKECSKDIGSGGGHRKAAGALVNNIEKFKERTLDFISG